MTQPRPRRRPAPPRAALAPVVVPQPPGAGARFAAIDLPPDVAAALDGGATLVLSISGGKDSHAMLRAVSALGRARGWRMRVVHADLGRAEWAETPAEVIRQATEAGLPLQVVRRPRGDLFARFEERLEATGGAVPFWPDAKNRYCTSHLKRGPIDTFLRQFAGVVVSAEGLRAEESAARGKKPCWEPRETITTRARTGLTWRPIHLWSLDDVWAALGTSREDVDRRRGLFRAGAREAALEGWVAHPAYVYGNHRLSCALCILADQNDLETGGRHNPAALEYLVQLERRSGYTFKHGYALVDLQARLARVAAPGDPEPGRVA